MLRHIPATLERAFKLYTSRQIPRSAAALSYYLTMTVFPMIVFLYALFGQSYSMALRVLNYLSQFLSAGTTELLRNYIRHVADSNSDGILLAAAMVMLMPASTAIRSLETAIAEMQGGRRFRMVTDILLSLVLAVALVGTFYFAIAAMVTGRTIITKLARHFPGLRVAVWWTWMRFLLLGSMVLLSLWGIFSLAKSREDHYRALPGAALSTVAIVVNSYIFSTFISASAHYSLVYGSLASLVLLMFWLFLTCQMILIGAAFNIGLRDAEA